jgi:hypothetical protein
MKVTYLVDSPLPIPGERMEIADIPDGVEWYLCAKTGTWKEGGWIYWKIGTVLWYHKLNDRGIKVGKNNSNPDWLLTEGPKQYVGEIA